ncbi:MAG: hypothetical protein JSU87_03120 [Gemmatimonadota bacterium]|nr:MAG: hypothetical protein JSU87_03120 [Gemmatimonadota bacterium]
MSVRLAWAMAIWLPLAQACTTVVVPPPEPSEPLPVLLLDHGHHASLAVPGPNGGIVRYAYGDWAYYARRKTNIFVGSAAVLWPTRSGLGRRELPGPPSPISIARHLRVWVEHAYTLLVEAESLERLRSRLDSIFVGNIDSRLYNPAYDLEFVRHPAPYWALHNSNQIVAAWLTELGCRIRGTALFSKWEIEPPGGFRGARR